MSFIIGIGLWMRNAMGAGSSPGGGNARLLEDGTSYRLLEDGTSFRLLE